jgi:hypothetical protein
MNTIRSISAVFLSALAMVASALNLSAASFPAGVGIGGDFNENAAGFGGKGVATTVVGSVVSNISWFITSARAVGYPRVTYADYTTTLGASGNLTFYVCTNSTTITNVAEANTNRFLVNNTNGFSPNDFVVVRNVAGDSYQFGVISNAAANAYTIETYQSTTNAAAVGDIIYEMTPAGSLSTGGSEGASITKAFSSSGGLFFGRPNCPLLITVTGSNAPTINLIAGDYLRHR